MKTLILLTTLLIPGISSAQGTGCTWTTGPFVLKRVRPNATGPQFVSCMNWNFDAISSSITMTGPGSTNTFHLVYVDTLAGGAGGAGVYVSTGLTATGFTGPGAGLYGIPQSGVTGLSTQLDDLAASTTSTSSSTQSVAVALSSTTDALKGDLSGRVCSSCSYSDPVWMSSISGGKLTSVSVDTSKLAADSVTAAKLYSDPDSLVKVSSGAMRHYQTYIGIGNVPSGVPLFPLEIDRTTTPNALGDYSPMLVADDSRNYGTFFGFNLRGGAIYPAGAYKGMMLNYHNGSEAKHGIVLTNTGKVGISTANPTTNLMVIGNASFGTTAQSTFSTSGALTMAPGTAINLTLSGGYITTKSSVNASGLFGHGGALTGLSGSQLAAGSVDTMKLADDAVSEPKLLAGAVSARALAAGAVTEEKLADGAALANLATGSVDSSKLASASVDVEKLAAGVALANLVTGSVDSSKLASASVDVEKLVDGAVSASKLAAGAALANLATGSVDSSKLASASVDVEKLVDGAVTGAKLAAGVALANLATGSVDSAKLASASVDVEKLVDGAVSASKLAAGAALANLATGSVDSAKLASASVDVEKLVDGAVTDSKLNLTARACAASKAVVSWDEALNPVCETFAGSTADASQSGPNNWTGVNGATAGSWTFYSASSVTTYGAMSNSTGTTAGAKANPTLFLGATGLVGLGTTNPNPNYRMEAIDQVKQQMWLHGFSWQGNESSMLNGSMGIGNDTSNALILDYDYPDVFLYNSSGNGSSKLVIATRGSEVHRSSLTMSYAGDLTLTLADNDGTLRKLFQIEGDTLAVYSNGALFLGGDNVSYRPRAKYLSMGPTNVNFDDPAMRYAARGSSTSASMRINHNRSAGQLGIIGFGSLGDYGGSSYHDAAFIGAVDVNDYDDLIFGAGGVTDSPVPERMRIKGVDGRVGIWTTAPDTTFQVGVATLAVNALTGRVGIGTTAPLSPLHVSNSNASQAMFSGYAPQFGASDVLGSILLGNSATYQGIIAMDSTDGNHTQLTISNLRDTGDSSIRFHTRAGKLAASTMTLTGDGNLGIGLTNPLTTLHVNGSISQYAIASCNNGLTTDSSGTINGCSASSRSLKRDVVRLKYNDSLIDKLQPVLYNFLPESHQEPKRRAGFIAEEIDAAFAPATVPAGVGVLGVDPNGINAILVMEAKALRKRVAALENDRARLSAVVNEEIAIRKHMAALERTNRELAKRLDALEKGK